MGCHCNGRLVRINTFGVDTIVETSVMANRHQRRKRSKARQLAETIRLVELQAANERRKLIRRNLASPIERTYNYGPSSVAMVARNAGPSFTASSEIAAMLRRKSYTVK